MTDTPKKLAGKKIAIVEDDKFLGGIISKKVTSEGGITTLISNGELAVDTLAKDVPHVLLLDLLLPGMSGFDILKDLRHNDATKNLPVIVFSNLGSKEDMVRAQALGATAFLIKATFDVNNIANELLKVIK